MIACSNFLFVFPIPAPTTKVDDTNGDFNIALVIAVCAGITLLVASTCGVPLARLLRRKFSSSSPPVNDPTAVKSPQQLAAPSADGGQLELHALRKRPNTNEPHSASSRAAGVDGFDASLVSNPLFSGHAVSASGATAVAPLPRVIVSASVAPALSASRASASPAAAAATPENVCLDVNPDVPSSNGSAEPSASAAAASDPYAGFRFENLGPDDYLGFADMGVDVPHIKFQKVATAAVNSL